MDESRHCIFLWSSLPWYHWKKLVWGFLGKSFQPKLDENWERYERRKLESQENSQKCEFSVAWSTNGWELNHTEWCLYTLHYIVDCWCLIMNCELKGGKGWNFNRTERHICKIGILIMGSCTWCRWKGCYDGFLGVVVSKWTDTNWGRYSIFFSISWSVLFCSSESNHNHIWQVDHMISGTWRWFLWVTFRIWITWSIHCLFASCTEGDGNKNQEKYRKFPELNHPNEAKYHGKFEFPVVKCPMFIWE